MHEKTFDIGSVDFFGEETCVRIDPTVGLEKTASGSSLSQAIRSFLSSFKPDPSKIYYLINPMGAGEFYGANVNGDFFSEADLLPVSDAYGHKTFKTRAVVYRNHRNKDPEKGFGRIVEAGYNPVMHRVELIAEIDPEKGRLLGHEDLIDALERNERAAVSMGCRVPYDECMICGHRAKTRVEYCEHAANNLGAVLPSGVKVAVRNPRPVFHDLSFVLVNADKTGFGLGKIASAGSVMTSSTTGPTGTVRGMDKSAASKMVKRILGLAEQLRIRKGQTGLRLSRPSLDKLASADFRTALTTAASCGIVLYPDEYLYLAYTAKGMNKEAADVLGVDFTSLPNEYRSMDDLSGDVDQTLVDELILNGDVQNRSVLEPFFDNHFCAPEVNTKLHKQASVGGLEGALLSAYNGYRAQLLTKVASLLENNQVSSAARRVLPYDPVQASIAVARGSGSSLPLSPLQMAYLFGAGMPSSVVGPVSEPDTTLPGTPTADSLSEGMQLVENVIRGALVMGLLKSVLDQGARENSGAVTTASSNFHRNVPTG